MKFFTRFAPLLFIGVIIATFFYKTVLFGQIPFPGDLLIAEYKPWQSYSYLGYVPGSYPNKAQYFDTLRQLYPWKTLVLNQLKQSKIPLWNPYNFSGTPLLANFQSAVFYPLNIMYLALPQTIAWTILVILQPFLALIFTYGYIRTIGGSRLAALLGALSYAFSLYNTVWLEYNTIGQVILWLPLILTAIEKMKNTFTHRWFAILIISQVCALLAGHPQIAAYLLFFILAYTWVRKRSLFKFVFVSTIFALGISAMQLIPGIEASLHAARSPHDFSFLFQKILIQPQQLLMIIIPNLFGHPATRTYWPTDTFVGKATYIGIIPLFFLLAAFRLKNSIIKFFSIAALLVLILMTANPLTFILYKLNIPIFSSSSPTLMEFLFTFCLAVITSLGLDAWMKEDHSVGKLAHRSLTVLVFFVIVWISFTLSSHTIIAQKAILYSLGLTALTLLAFFLAITRRKLMIPILTILMLIHAADLFYHFQKFNPFVPTSLVFPKTEIFSELQRVAGINRFWGYGTAAIEANFATQYQLFSPDGYDPLYPKRYGEFIGSTHDGKILSSFTTQTRSDAMVAGGYGEKDLPSNLYRLRVLDVLGVKYILDRTENGSTTQTFAPERFSEIYNKDGWKILENHKAAPRIFLTSSYRIFQNNKDFEKIFFDKNFDPTQTILLEQSLQKDLQKPINEDHMQLQIYTTNEVRLTTTTDGDRLLFLSDNYYPGWEAWIDAATTKIYRADYTFRAIYVPKGEHTIRFVYKPFSLRVGTTISIISILITFFGIGILSWKKYEKK